MSKPVPHYDKWRIRWTDEKGTRRSKTFTEFKTADLALRKAELEAAAGVLTGDLCLGKRRLGCCR